MSITDDNGGGWNYKHIAFEPGLAEGKRVQAGDVIGKVAPTSAAKNGFAIPPHLHLERGTVFGDPYQPKWVRSNVNVMTQFDLTGNDTAVPTDATKPVVESVQFRLQADDVRATGWQNVEPLRDRPVGPVFGGQETPRTTSRYFTAGVSIPSVGETPLTHLGRLATASSQGGATSTNKADNANIDLVVNAHDLFGTGAAKLNPRSMRISVTGRGQAPPQFEARTFDFSSLANSTKTAMFVDGNITRTLYENDAKNNSGFVGPFFFNATNTPSNEQAGDPTDIRKLNSKFYWNSDVARGREWNDTNEERNAASNARSRFPDGVYDVAVTVADYSGNTTTKTVTVLLQNWQRTVTTSMNEYQESQPIEITGGRGYRASDRVTVYAVPVGPGGLANGTRLEQADALGLLDTGGFDPDDGAAAGKLIPDSLAHNRPVGKYWLVVDYNGDGEFTRELDAVNRIRIIEDQQAPPDEPYEFVGVGDFEWLLTPPWGGDPEIPNSDSDVSITEFWLQYGSDPEVAVPEIMSTPAIGTITPYPEGGLNYFRLVMSREQWVNFTGTLDVSYRYSAYGQTSNTATIHFVKYHVYRRMRADRLRCGPARASLRRPPTRRVRGWKA